MKQRWTIALAIVIVGSAVSAAAASFARSDDGRQLTGEFCTNAMAMPKPGACISLSYGGTTAQGYTDSIERTLTLRPGTYWLSVNDTSLTHNFALESPDGSDQDLTAVAEAPGWVTVKVDLSHGHYTLFCDPHRMMGMYVDIEVGGVGQVG
jgi:hypothetical protein